MTRKSERGFTLPDATIAAVIVGAMLAATIPLWKASQESLRVTTAADELSSELQAARLLAISRNATLEVNVSTATGSYQVVDPSDATNPPRNARSLPTGVSFQQTPATPLRFTSRGASQGGTIRVGDGRTAVTLTVSTSGKTRVR